MLAVLVAGAGCDSAESIRQSGLVPRARASTTTTGSRWRMRSSSTATSPARSRPRRAWHRPEQRRERRAHRGFGGSIRIAAGRDGEVALMLRGRAARGRDQHELPEPGRAADPQLLRFRRCVPALDPGRRSRRSRRLADRHRRLVRGVVDRASRSRAESRRPICRRSSRCRSSRAGGSATSCCSAPARS